MAGKHKYSFSSEQCIQDLWKIKLKKRSEKKIYQGVTAYNDWHNARLETFNYDYAIYMDDLNIGKEQFAVHPNAVYTRSNKEN